MRAMKGLSVLLVLLLCGGSHGWTNEEFEMFDLVEELGSVTFYEFLGVKKEATTREIKSAYRQLSVKLHPDKNPDDPNAPLKFRQLVGVYESLKDDELRKSYHNVLEFGLPNWKMPVFYFRRARKLSIWQVGIILLAIVTITQYLAAWGGYFERKLSWNEYIESKRKKRTKKAQKEMSSVEEAEMEKEYLRRPSWLNTAPFQLLKLGKYLIVQFPFDLIAFARHIQEQKREEQERLLREKELEEERNLPPEPKKPRKRKTFQIPEKEVGEYDSESTKSAASEAAKTEKAKRLQETFVSGGLWTDDDIAQLIKLCTKYPGGYPDRWNTISQMMRRPVAEITHMAKKVMEDLNKKQEEEEETVVAVKVKVKTKGSKLEDAETMQKVLNWNKDEQKRLESALQMYPKNMPGDRWAKIASHVGKPKEECMQRYRHVAEMVKKKKSGDGDTQGQSPEHKEEEVAVTAVPNVQSPTEEPEPDISKEDVTRKHSSSSSNGSDNDWCLVDEQKS